MIVAPVGFSGRLKEQGMRDSMITLWDIVRMPNPESPMNTSTEVKTTAFRGDVSRVKTSYASWWRLSSALTVDEARSTELSHSQGATEEGVEFGFWVGGYPLAGLGAKANAIAFE